MDKINPFRNPEDDNLVDTIRAVLSGKPIEEAEMDSVNPKAVKKKFKDRKDKDIDNDGDVDDSDKFLHKRRKAISKAVAKEDTDDNPANRQHLCAKNVVHEEWGEGECIPTMHADPDKEGHVAWYDIMFEHGIETKVSIDELKVTKEAGHTHNEKKKKKVDEAGHDDEEGQDTDTEKDKKKDDKKVGKGKKDDIDTEPKMDDSKMVSEKEMTDDQKKKREEIVKSMKKDMPSFKKKYGDRAKDVMYATATKMAMK
jgi:hypothetical protein